MSIFKIEAKDTTTAARAGIFKTNHGEVPTPAFMPVATKGTVKALSVNELHEMGTNMIIANALHLHIRPGEAVLQRNGGLHGFMGWNKSLITDSGGFQLVRETFGLKRTENGLHFKDPYDGTPRHYTPEDCMDVQKAIGSDVAMLLDDCPPHDATPAVLTKAVERSIHWAKRGVEHGRKIGIPLIFAITQGGRDLNLRKHCTLEMEALKPDGFGIGGLSLGESKEEMMKILDESTHLLPEQKPRYLMGVGSAREMLDSIALGVDIFDSAFPTQCARHGTVLTSEGRLLLKGRKLCEDDRPLDLNCSCPVCKTYTRSYINHLQREREILGLCLASYHNVHYILELARKAREAILAGAFDDFRNSIYARMKP